MERAQLENYSSLCDIQCGYLLTGQTAVLVLKNQVALIFMSDALVRMTEFPVIMCSVRASSQYPRADIQNSYIV